MADVARNLQAYIPKRLATPDFKAEAERIRILEQAETQAAQRRAERLAGLGRVDGQRLALEVELLVLHRGGPREGLGDLVRTVGFLELRAFFGDRRLVVVVAE